LNRFGARARAPTRRRTPTRHVVPALPRSCAHAKAPENPRSEASVVATVDIRLMTRASGLGRCHTASPHSPACEPPFTIGRRSAARCHRLCAHAHAPIGHEARVQPPRRIVEPIKPPSLLSSRVPEPHYSLRRPPLAPLVNLLLHSHPWPTDDLRLLPSTHLSSYAHVMA
jgi:hypothetical protein